MANRQPTGKQFDPARSPRTDRQLAEVFRRHRGHNLSILVLLYRGYYPALAGSMFFFIIKNSPTWVIPVVTANLINAVTQGSPDIARTIAVNAAVLILFLLQNIPTNYIHTLLYARSVRAVEYQLRRALVAKLQVLSIPFHRSIQSGRLQSKLMRDVEQIQTLSSQIFLSVLTTLLNIAVSFGVVLYKSRVIFLFYLLTMPVAILLIVLFQGKIRYHNRDFRRAMEDTSARVMEMVEMIPVARAHALENREIHRMDDQLEGIAQKGLRLDMVQTYFSSISWVAFQIFQVLCLAFTAFLATRQLIGVGDITLYQSYFTSIVAQISNLISLLPILSKGLESVDSIGDILCSEDVEQSEGKPCLQDVKGEIRFSHVSYRYPGGEDPVLRDLNLTIHPGETVAFVGASGSGKSTILSLAIGFLRPTDGAVYLDGRDLNAINLQSYRRHIALVPQQPVLFTGTVRENITCGMEGITDERLREIVRAANLEEMVSRLPRGVDTMITEHGGNLSGGQRQRIALARAFARDPEVLILDEATSALDSVSEQKIQDSIQRLVHGRTTLIVAHRLSTIRNADRIAVVGNGGLLECGSYDELMARRGEFYKMKTLQS